MAEAKTKPAKSSGNPAGKTVRDYWEESRRPLTSLYFVLPLLVFYEAGVLVLGPGSLRNGADVWLRSLLAWIGFGEYFLLPVLTVLILLGWHHLTGRSWRVSVTVIYGMAAESTLLAIALLMIAHLQLQVLPLEIVEPLFIREHISRSITNRLVCYIGAGIYEELLFRLMLFTAILGLVRIVGGRPAAQMWIAVIASSLLFSAAHYVGRYGDPWALDSFVFRFIAGAFFAVLFYYRGFGIAAGSHALYDVLVGFR